MAHRVLVIDDDHRLSAALVALLTAFGYEATGAHTAGDGLQRALSDGADCLLIDQGLPDGEGVALLRTLRAHGVQAPAIVLTGRSDVCTAVAAIRAGAFDYLEKPCRGEVIAQRVADAIAEATGDATDAPSPDLATLTRREREVMEHVVAGLTNKQIAGALGLSVKTVEVHRSRVMRKTGAQNLAELVRLRLTGDGLHTAATPTSSSRRKADN